MITSRPAWLHRGATSASPMSIRAELDKLRYLRDLDAHALDFHAAGARRRRLVGIGRRATNQALPTSTSGIRCCWPRSPSALSRSSTKWCRCLTISGTENGARRKLDELLAQRARASVDRLSLLEEILTVCPSCHHPRHRRGAMDDETP